MRFRTSPTRHFVSALHQMAGGRRVTVRCAICWVAVFVIVCALMKTCLDITAKHGYIVWKPWCTDHPSDVLELVRDFLRTPFPYHSALTNRDVRIDVVGSTSSTTWPAMEFHLEETLHISYSICPSQNATRWKSGQLRKRGLVGDLAYPPNDHPPIRATQQILGDMWRSRESDGACGMHRHGSYGLGNCR